jgi:glycogen(starch) synthase
MIPGSSVPGRVLMTTDTVGGVWTYVIDLARALGEQGIEVALATMGAPVSPGQRSEALAIDTLELFESRYRLPWMDEPWDDVLAAGDWLLDLEARLGPDLVHLNEPVYGSLCWPVPILVVGHSCVLSWWHAVWKSPAPEEWDRYRHAMSEGLSAADEVVAPSSWMLQALRRNYGVKTGRVVPNGRAPGQFSPRPKAELVFAAGRLWDPAKNLLVLNQVANGLAWPIYIAGEARHPSGEARISAEHLHLLGRLEPHGVAAWLRHASIYAFPARYEPFGLSILEAALAGCTLVLGDLPTLRELWEGVASFVPPEEPEALRSAIETLIEDPASRQTLGARARERALTFTPRRMAQGYLQAYSDVLSSRSPRLKESTCAS